MIRFLSEQWVDAMVAAHNRFLPARFGQDFSVTIVSKSDHTEQIFSCVVSQGRIVHGSIGRLPGADVQFTIPHDLLVQFEKGRQRELLQPILQGEILVDGDLWKANVIGVFLATPEWWQGTEALLPTVQF